MAVNGINRNILECKAAQLKQIKKMYEVLIETYWNVKFVAVSIIVDDALGINRNILECKGISTRNKSSGKSCINRNILECKAGKNIRIHGEEQVLIETYWNVKA